MKRILLLTAAFGDGHTSAARALAASFRLVDPACDVQIRDVFAEARESTYRWLRRAYVGMICHAPRLYHALFCALGSPRLLGWNAAWQKGLQARLRAELERTQPDLVVCTYPLYSQLIARLWPGDAARPFRLVTVVTDSQTVNPAWYCGAAGEFVVTDEATAAVLRSAGVAPGRVQALGFPVLPDFAEPGPLLDDPARSGQCRVLCLVNSAHPRLARFAAALLDLPGVQLTLVCGRRAGLQRRLGLRFRGLDQRVRVLGWTGEMPRLLRSHHLVLTKAGGAIVHEALAARCPMILAQVVPGQEEGNARMVLGHHVGALALEKTAVVNAVRQALADHARQWHAWRGNFSACSRPDAGLRIADHLLGAAGAARQLTPPSAALQAEGGEPPLPAR